MANYGYLLECPEVKWRLISAEHPKVCKEFYQCLTWANTIKEEGKVENYRVFFNCSEKKFVQLTKAFRGVCPESGYFYQVLKSLDTSFCSGTASHKNYDRVDVVLSSGKKIIFENGYCTIPGLEIRKDFTIQVCKKYSQVKICFKLIDGGIGYKSSSEVSKILGLLKE